MAISAPDLGAFSYAEKQNILTAVKAEVLIRLTPGSVRTGASAGQSFGVDKWTGQELTMWLNALTAELGFQQPELRVQPNFSQSPSAAFGSYGSGSSAPTSGIDGNITSWADLAAVPTNGLPNGTIKGWVEASTGLARFTRLIPGTDATDTANGIQRPNDYSSPGNLRVWYLAS